jgi:cyclopropane fatty-acyl-phospholipid synthase-like methyltransferase
MPEAIMVDDDTLRFYAENAATYVQRQRGIGSHLATFLAALPPGATILELGSGGGDDAAFMLSQGFDIHPTDASPELAAEASRHIGRPVQVMRFDGLDAEARYDAVWASASLLHAEAAELTGNLTQIHRALKPGGLFVASFKAGNGEGRDQFGRYYNYPSAQTLLAHYQAAAAWTELGLTEEDGTGYDALPTRWLWVTARR